MSFPKYPKYKASGVEWLGDVPEGWEVVRLRQIGPLLKGGGGSKEDITETGVPCVRYGDLYMTHSYHINATRTRISEARAIDYTPIRFGDVLFAASGEKLAEIGKSAVNLMTAPAVCGGDVVILRPTSDVDARFLGYSADSPLAAMQKASMGRGTTIKHIYPDELRQLMLTLPPLPEQLAITAFLYRETAKIDELVEAQARLIELLKEKRQAVISHAVTKGLNPHAPMKPSGVEWLGEVPEGWEVVAIKWLSPVRRGASPRPIDDPKYFDDEGEFGWVRIADVSACDGVLLETTQRLSELGSSLSVKIAPGELFVSIAGTVGKPCIAGTRITVYDVLEYLAGGMTEQQILSDFPALTSEHIKATLAFAAQRERRLAS